MKEEIHQNLEESRNRMERDEDMIALMMRLINGMGECLIKLDRLDLAKQCFSSIANGFKVMEVYKREYEANNRKNLSEEEKLKALMDYMRIARKYERLELAVELAQEAFHISQVISDFNRLKGCADFIKSIATKRRETQSDQYSNIDYIT